MSDCLWPHGLQHARLPCPSLSPAVCTNSCPLSRWCHPAISYSVASFFSCPQSFPASESFPVSWLLAAGGQTIGASASVLPMNIQGWFSLGLTGLISCCAWDSQEFSPAPQFKASVLRLSAFFVVQLSHLYMTTEKTVTLIAATKYSSFLLLFLFVCFLC